ncbi:hypothetical protein [Pseudomonas sp. BF-R-30]|uniref:hypothetical protein n=1 Tax=Pseudomonas sp. BF-R-30 TaxID=2832384 RepID=UPI001CBDEBAD|nr:hypothetical protein [Pseudomonas sp. BF-R-30]
MSEWISCIAEREPREMHVDGLGLSVRLSIATEEVDNDIAKVKIIEALESLPSLQFAIYIENGPQWRLADPAPQIARAFNADAQQRLIDWLHHYPRPKIFAEAGNVHGRNTDLARTATDINAHELLLSAASQVAPAPQHCGLAVILLTDEPELLATSERLLVMPYPPGAELEQAFNGPPGGGVTGELLRHAYTAPIIVGGVTFLGFESPPVADTGGRPMMIGPDGFVRPSDESPDMYKLLRRFETQAGSVLSGNILARSIDWTEGLELEKIEVDPLLYLRRLVWTAVYGLSSALDTLLLAMIMPRPDRGRPAGGVRDGALLAPFFKYLDDELVKRADEPSPPVQYAPPDQRRQILRRAVQQRVAELAIAGGRRALPDADKRQQFIDELRDIAGLTGASAPEVWFLDALLTTYQYLDDPAQWALLTATAADLVQSARTGASDTRNYADILSQLLTMDLVKVDAQSASETGTEAATLRILKLIEDPTVSWIRDAIHDTLDDQQIRGAWQAAVERLRAFFDKDGGNGLEAARISAGSLFTDQLYADLTNIDLSLRDLQDAVTAWRFWHERFIAHTGVSIEPIVDVLAHPISDLAKFFATADPVGSPPLDIDQDAIDILCAAAAAAMQPAVDQLLPFGGRFVPDTVPQPIAIRFLIDAHADDDGTTDDFAAAFSGIALLLNRVSEPGQAARWSWTNLAELVFMRDKAISTPSFDCAIRPIPVSENDGRREVFLPYDGKPYTLLMPMARPNEASYPLVKTRYPRAVNCGAAAPALGYGSVIEAVGCAVGRAGSLPHPVQGDEPWLPSADPRIEEDWIARYAISRTTAIGAAQLLEGSSKRRIGVVPQATKTLALDYPHLSLGGIADSNILDIFRGKDGVGLLAVEPGNDQHIILDEIRSWKGDAQVGFAALCAPDTSLQKDHNGAYAWVPIPAGAATTVALRISEQSGEILLTISIDGTTVGQVLAARPSSVPVWIRVKLAGPSPHTSISLRDPAHHRGAAPLRPENLVLAAADAPIWTEAVRKPAQLMLSAPRVSSVDFARAMEYRPLFQAVFGANLDRGHAFLDLLMGAELDRERGASFLPLLDSLPDPLVDELLIELLPQDSLADRLEVISSAGSLAAAHLKLSLPNLGRLFEKIEAVLDIDRALAERRLGDILSEVDRLCRFPLSISGIDQGPLRLTSGAHGLRINTPAGSVSRLRVRSLVAARYFAVGAGSAPVIDDRLLQWAEGTIASTAGDHWIFAGPDVQIETMLGPLVAGTNVHPWQTRRDEWAALVDSIVVHTPRGIARSYELAVDVDRQAHDRLWCWRQVGWVETATQRWRFMGQPIYHWADPRSISRPVKYQAQASLELDLASPSDRPEWGSVNRGASWLRFETEAFLGRDDADYEPQTVDITSGGARTRLVEIEWEKPSATVFRHRFTLRSRYAGAIATGQASVLATSPPGSSNFEEGAWRRIVMLADRSHLTLPRPQLRALMPLTRPPERDALVAPPLLAMLQEQPFAYGGLADRVSARIDSAIRYSILDGTLVIESVSSEFGPGPEARPIAIPESVAERFVTPAEGPIGLTFDSLAASAPAYANTGYLLALKTLGTDGTITPASIDYENHLVKVVLQRYLAAEWLVASPSPVDVFHFAQTHWLEALAVPSTLAFMPVDAAPAMLPAGEWLKIERAGPDLKLWIAKVAIDPTFWSTVSTLPPGASPVEPWLRVATIAVGADVTMSIGLLLVPLDARRGAVSVFLQRPGEVPILLRSLTYGVPDAFAADTIRYNGLSATRTEASDQTPPQWSRISPNFNIIHGAVPGSEGVTKPMLVEQIDARLDAASRRISMFGPGPAAAPVWPRGKVETPRSPSHYQSHVAVLVSQSVETLGTPIERPHLARLINGNGFNLPDDFALEHADFVRFMEFQVPGAIYGYLPGQGEQLPDIYRRARFDLTAIGFDRARPATTLVFSVCFRLLGDIAARQALRSLEIDLEADQTPIEEESVLALAPTKLALSLNLPNSVNKAVAEILLDLEVGETGSLKPKTTRCIFDDGTSLDFTPDAVGAKLLPAFDDPVDERAQGLAFTNIQPVFARGDHSIWFEIGMLGTGMGRGFQERLDFDWFFGTGEVLADKGTLCEELRTMFEAQAVMVRFSHAVPISSSITTK